MEMKELSSDKDSYLKKKYYKQNYYLLEYL